jgi:hypothetical protein
MKSSLSIHYRAGEMKQEEIRLLVQGPIARNWLNLDLHPDSEDFAVEIRV